MLIFRKRWLRRELVDPLEGSVRRSGADELRPFGDYQGILNEQWLYEVPWVRDRC